jgi:copper transport protein
MSLFELLTFILAVTALITPHVHLNKLLSRLALLSVGCARAASGHAATADPVWLMRPVVFLHTTMIAIWFGSLPPLLWLALTQINAFKDALWRFATTALMSVEILLIAGLILATVQMREATTLLTTDYGRVLLIKLSLVSLLLLLALWNRRIATPRVMADEKRACKLITVSIAMEIVLIISILGVAALWRFTPPPRAILEANMKTSASSIHLHSNALMVDLKVEPPMSGNTRLTIFMQDEAGMPLSAKEVAVTLHAPWLGIEPRTLFAERLDIYLWQIPSAYLPAPGEWTATINVMVDDFEQRSVEGKLKIQRSEPPK